MANFEIDALRAHPSRDPVTMLNLVKFRDWSLDGHGTGRDAYERYSDIAYRLVSQRGGKIMWAGEIDGVALHEGGDADWDWGLLVNYPSRAAFVDMVTSEEYQRANVHRENGTEKHLILPCQSILAVNFRTYKYLKLIRNSLRYFFGSSSRRTATSES